MRLLLLLGFLLLAQPAFALTFSKHSCRILLKIQKLNGETQKLQFSSKMKSKEACQTLAEIHRKNFDPRLLKSKSVSYVWTKTTKKIPLLARQTIKKSKKPKLKRTKVF